MTLLDYIKVWNKVRIEKWRDGDLHVYEEAAQELRNVVGDKPTIVWFSGSNGPLFGFGSFFAIDADNEVIAERCCLVE
jgi:hypothetical protein